MDILGKYIKKYKWWFVASFVLIGTSAAAQLIQPNILATIITAIVQQDTSTITRLGVILIGLALLGFVAGILNTVIAARIAQRVGSELRGEIFEKVQEFSYSNIEKFSASNLVIRLVNDTQQVQNLIMIMLQSLTRIPVMFIGSFILAMTVLPQFWWIVILAIALVGLVVGAAFGKMGPRFGKIQMLIEKINAIAKENFIGMRVVKSFVQEDSEKAKFNTESDILTKETIQIGYIFSIMMPSFFLIMDTGIALVMILVGRSAEVDPSIIGNSVSFISYLVMVMMSLMIGGMMVSFSSRAFVSLGRIKEVMETVRDMDYVSESETIATGDVVFEDVSFAYAEDTPDTLKHISFSVKHGETLGIVGATGAGKTSLVQLMARIYDPSSGRVLIGNQDLKAVSEAVLRQDVALVLQRPTLFSGTIADTIRQGKKDASLEAMQRAADIAQASEFIAKEPKGFESEVYQRGANFSGGQKQRLSIARGLVGNPKVLILDDSTSALDAKSEKKVQEALKTDLPDTTKIIVSQKISSIIHANNILVLDDGELVAQGTQESLMKTSEIYQRIFESQKGKNLFASEE